MLITPRYLVTEYRLPFEMKGNSSENSRRLLRVLFELCNHDPAQWPEDQLFLLEQLGKLFVNNENFYCFLADHLLLTEEIFDLTEEQLNWLTNFQRVNNPVHTILTARYAITDRRFQPIPIHEILALWTQWTTNKEWTSYYPEHGLPDFISQFYRLDHGAPSKNLSELWRTLKKHMTQEELDNPQTRLWQKIAIVSPHKEKMGSPQHNPTKIIAGH